MEVLALAAGLGRGESRGGQVCPQCGGGRHKDKSFSVSHGLDGTILYMCHRATCGYRGRIRTHLEVVNPVNTASNSVRLTYAPEERESVDDSTAARIHELYGITYSTVVHAGVRQYSDRVCIPTTTGWEYRYLPPYPPGVSKTKTYREVEGIPLFDMWVNMDRDSPLVLVEDAWSAMKAAQELGWNSVAIMGSHISDDMALHLATEWPSCTVYLCLDKDATEKAVKFVNKYRLLFNDLRFVPLQRDLKYLNGEELKQLFGV